MKHLLPFLLLLLAACTGGRTGASHAIVDSLNHQAYTWHYRNIDSTRALALQAYELALQTHDVEGQAEALNHLTFERFQQMDFDSALILAQQVEQVTESPVEQLISDVMQMKVAQRTSDNRAFFVHRRHAQQRLQRIVRRESSLTPHHLHRLNYARSEFHIVSSTYFYYLDQHERAIDEIRQAEPYAQMPADTAQWLYYCYMRGSGGLADNTDDDAITREEFNYLLKCFWLARYEGYLFFEGNAEQSLATLFADSARLSVISEAHPEALLLLHSIFGADSTAQRMGEAALNAFIAYDDLYQEACALRTLGELAFGQGHYEEAVECYRAALDCVNFHHQCYYETDEILEPDEQTPLLEPYDPSSSELSVERQWMQSPEVKTVPEWIAGIRQQLSVAFSALDMKAESDYNRNIYLDLLDVTREDAELESRVAELQAESRLLRRIWILVAVMAVLIGLLVALLLRTWRRRSEAQNRLLSQKMQQLRDYAQQQQETLAEEQEQIEEQQRATELRLLRNKQQNIEKRAKLQLVYGIMPFLDRIIHEVRRMKQRQQAPAESLAYIGELTTRITELNDLLTEWIKMEQGQLSLQLSSFALEPLFSAIRRSHYAYDQKGLTLDVRPTDLSVKADRSLTLFMLNTLADNARKFTPTGGSVTISATASESADGPYVELSVQDTGCGLSADDINLILNNKVYDAAVIGSITNETRVSDHTCEPTHTVAQADATVRVAPNEQKGFGFGLMNCKGIIEKYRKTNPLFRVCQFGIESRVGEGSRFWFRLPRVLTMLVAALLAVHAYAVSPSPERTSKASPAFPAEAYALADSVYYCNLDGRYAEAILFAKQAFTLMGEGRDSLDYSLVLGLRNEVAIAALALHDWPLYRKNNTLYTRLYKQVNQDASLESYCQQVERSQQHERLALAALIFLFVVGALAAYFFYVRPRQRFRRSVAELNARRLQQLGEQQQREHELQQADIEMAEDEHRRRLYEEERLHVQNQIMDNCLSTIKHETMYYPGRIQQLVDRMRTSAASLDFLDTLSETAAYYKEVYTLLTAQASQQSAALNFRRRNIKAEELTEPAASRFANRARRLGVDVSLKIDNALSTNAFRGDPDLLLMLVNALLDAELDATAGAPSSAQSPSSDTSADQGANAFTLAIAPSADQRFAVFTLTNPFVTLTDVQLHDLFTPHEGGIPYLICKQIIREHDTFMGHPGCRINAEAAQAGHAIWFTVPLSKDLSTS